MIQRPVSSDTRFKVAGNVSPLTFGNSLKVGGELYRLRLSGPWLLDLDLVPTSTYCSYAALEYKPWLSLALLDASLVAHRVAKADRLFQPKGPTNEARDVGFQLRSKWQPVTSCLARYRSR